MYIRYESSYRRLRGCCKTFLIENRKISFFKARKIKDGILPELKRMENSQITTEKLFKILKY